MYKFIVFVNNKNMEKTNTKQKWLLEKYVAYFFIYGFIGWFIELIIMLFDTHEIVNRGFLTLPILPIYGFGAVIISMIFKEDDYQWIFTAIVGGIVATAIELISSFIFTDVFDIILWDYSGLKYNFQGRISLITSVGFMIASVVLIKVTNPIIEKKLRRFKYNHVFEIILSSLCVLTFVDFIKSIIKSLKML